LDFALQCALSALRRGALVRRSSSKAVAQWCQVRERTIADGGEPAPSSDFASPLPSAHGLFDPMWNLARGHRRQSRCVPAGSSQYGRGGSHPICMSVTRRVVDPRGSTGTLRVLAHTPAQDRLEHIASI
jgi:hypothetical protein